LRGGQLFLFRDLVLSHTSRAIFSEGRIDGNNHYLIFSESCEDLAFSFTLKDVSVFIDSSFSINAPVVFSGTTVFDGQGNALNLQDGGRIYVDDNSSLTLENVTLSGVKGLNLKCQNDSSSITLKNSKIHLTEDFDFVNGSILFQKDVVLCGAYQFGYSTSRSSTIDSNSVLYVDEGTIFKYSPSTPDRDLLIMEDQSSCFYLNNCTLHSTSTGIILTKGTLFLDNKVTLSAEGTALSEAICFGNGTPSDDLLITLLAGAELNVYGRWEYKNSS